VNILISSILTVFLMLHEFTVCSSVLSLFLNRSLLPGSTVLVWVCHYGQSFVCAFDVICSAQQCSCLPSATSRCQCIMRCLFSRIFLALVSAQSTASWGLYIVTSLKKIYFGYVLCVLLYYLFLFNNFRGSLCKMLIFMSVCTVLFGEKSVLLDICL